MSEEQIIYVDEALALVNATAGKAAGIYSPYVDAEDLRQEAWVWLMGRVERVNEAFAAEAGSGRWSLSKDLGRHLRSIGAREKAHALGYRPEDDYAYRRAVLEMFLPIVAAGSYEEPARGESDGRSNPRPSEGNNWLAMRTDVACAWDKRSLILTPRELEALSLNVIDGYSYAEVATVMDTTEISAQRSVQRAFEKLCDELNTPIPRYDSKLPRRPRGSADQQNPWE